MKNISVYTLNQMGTEYQSDQGDYIILTPTEFIWGMQGAPEYTGYSAKKSLPKEFHGKITAIIEKKTPYVENGCALVKTTFEAFRDKVEEAEIFLPDNTIVFITIVGLYVKVSQKFQDSGNPPTWSTYLEAGNGRKMKSIKEDIQNKAEKNRDENLLR